jgi:hypothetical protein
MGQGQGQRLRVAIHVRKAFVSAQACGQVQKYGGYADLFVLLSWRVYVDAWAEVGSNFTVVHGWCQQTARWGKAKASG